MSELNPLSPRPQAPKPSCAVILCGGRGRRLRPVTDELPKPMVLVGGIPILEHVVAALWSQGVRRFVLPTGWLGARIRAHVPHLQSRFPGSFHVVETGNETPIAQRLHQVRSHLEQELDFYLVNGDTLFDLDLDLLQTHHRRTQSIVTLASIEIPSRFGLILDDGRGVSGFTREASVAHLNVAQGGTGHKAWINAGIALMRPEVFGHFDPEQCENFEASVYPRLIELGRLGHQHLRGPWFCIDNLDDLEKANEREHAMGKEALAA